MFLGLWPPDPPSCASLITSPRGLRPPPLPPSFPRRSLVTTSGCPENPDSLCMSRSLITSANPFCHEGNKVVLPGMGTRASLGWGGEGSAYPADHSTSSTDPDSNPMHRNYPFSAFRQRNWGSERLRNFSKDAQKGLGSRDTGPALTKPTVTELVTTRTQCPRHTNRETLHVCTAIQILHLNKANVAIK